MKFGHKNRYVRDYKDFNKNKNKCLIIIINYFFLRYFFRSY